MQQCLLTVEQEQTKVLSRIVNMMANLGRYVDVLPSEDGLRMLVYGMNRVTGMLVEMEREFFQSFQSGLCTSASGGPVSVRCLSALLHSPIHIQIFTRLDLKSLLRIFRPSLDREHPTMRIHLSPESFALTLRHTDYYAKTYRVPVLNAEEPERVRFNKAHCDSHCTVSAKSLYELMSVFPHTINFEVRMLFSRRNGIIVETWVLLLHFVADCCGSFTGITEGIKPQRRTHMSRQRYQCMSSTDTRCNAMLSSYSSCVTSNTLSTTLRIMM